MPVYKFYQEQIFLFLNLCHKNFQSNYKLASRSSERDQIDSNVTLDDPEYAGFQSAMARIEKEENRAEGSY